MSVLQVKRHGRSYGIKDPGGLMGNALRAGSPYEARVLEHIYRKGLTGLAVDAGASIGNHTLWFAVVCGLQVIAVEPLVHRPLRENVALNELGDQVQVWPVALGSSPGKTQVRGAPAHVVGEQDFPPDGQVPVVRLDDFDLRELALLKIDVEGMEPEVLRGAAETIGRERPLIYAEAEDEAARGRNAEVLEDLGYRHTRTFGATPLDEWEPQ